jgi:hypothetical protein
MSQSRNDELPADAIHVQFPKQTMFRKRKRGATSSPALSPTYRYKNKNSGGLSMLPGDNDYSNNNDNSNDNSNGNDSNNNMNGNGNGAVYSNGNTDDQVNTNSNTSTNSNSNQEQQYSQLSQNDIQFSSVTLYSEMLLLGVVLWILYLILPKGLRQYMCNSYPKRYAKSKPGREVPIHLLKFNYNAQTDSPRRVMRQYHHRGGGAPSELSMRSSSTATGFSSANANANRNARSYYAQQHAHQRRGRGDNNSDIFDTNSNAAMSIDQRIDSGIASGRQGLRPIHSNGPNSSVSVSSHQSPAVSNTSSTGTWDPHTQNGMHRAFDQFPTSNQHGNGAIAITPFRVHDPGDELIDFFTPGKPRLRVRAPPSLIELESLASFSQASPMPSSHNVNGDPVDPSPSPVHPNDSSNHRVPSHMVLSSTLTSLREPGIRLHAHGTQCEPRRIWIQLEVHKEMLEWRTENRSDPKEIDDNANANENGNNFTRARSVQETYTLGPKHMIPLQDIIYVDVGKTTAALQLLGEDEFSCDVCFSVLTRNGSLDLNAGNKLERDALISCLCLILDTIHLDKGNGNGNGNVDGRSWRDLHSQGSLESQSTRTEDRSSNYQKSGSGVSSGNGNGNGSSSNGHYTGGSATSPTDSDVFAGIDAMTDVSNAFEEV